MGESPHFQVSDQALSLWKDTVMLYLSKCQKEMIWRRLFIIFKDIELNHWNNGVKQLANEVVLYYERIDFEYWKKLKLEYEENIKKAGTKNGEIEDVIGVPITLDPKQFHDKKLEKIKIRKDERVIQYERMRELAMKNKANFVTCDDTKSEEEQHIMNGNIEHNEDENVRSKNENS